LFHAAADPGNAERVPSRTPWRHIRVQCHRRAVQDVGPLVEEIGERAFLELLHEDDVRVILNSASPGRELQDLLETAPNPSARAGIGADADRRVPAAYENQPTARGDVDRGDRRESQTDHRRMRSLSASGVA